MYRRTASPVIQQPLLVAMLKALSTVPAGALLTTPHLELFTNVLVLNSNMAYSAFTMATFHGYAAASVTMNAPSNLTGGDQCVTCSGFFQATTGGVLTPETLTGYALTDGVSTVYEAENFATPVNIAVVGDFLVLDFILPLLIRPNFSV